MCDCIEMVNKKLEPRNTVLLTPLMVVLPTGENDLRKRMMLATEKIDTKKRGLPIALFAAYCPVCGERYPTIEEIASSPSSSQ